MNKIRRHRFIISVITIATLGLIIESYFEGWEFWVLPLLAIGIIALWTVYLRQRMEDANSEMLYLIFGMLGAFFHGVHETSFFDVSIIIMLMLVTYSLLDRMFMLNCLMAEYAFIMFIQFVLVTKSGSIVFDSLNISRTVLHIAAVLCVYFYCKYSVENRKLGVRMVEENRRNIEAYDKDMEDFLSNISHELRTPVNVVNGMSALLLKKGVGREVDEIRNAGARLSYQIEDIQDYTEVKRGKVVLEEENYISTSLINDVVAGLKLQDKMRELEFVVDFDPLIPMIMKGDIRKLEKIFRHLIDNACKFTRRGGVYLRVYSMPRDYGVNLCIEITDTGMGMERKDISSTVKGLYQANKKRNRSTGGIGLGLFVVYGLVHRMGGFVKIESEKGSGTTVRATIPQIVIDPTPSLSIDSSFDGNVVFHVRPDKYDIPQVREFYKSMAVNVAQGLKCPLYSAETVKEVERLMHRLNVTHIFMGREEYELNQKFFDDLAGQGITVAVSAFDDFIKPEGSRIVLLPKPLYGFTITRLLNGAVNTDEELSNERGKVLFEGLKVLIVDDEPMNLVVAAGLFGDYRMITEVAGSGMEAVKKYQDKDYDVIFMDHMMPEMDGVEAMKRLRDVARNKGSNPLIVALTANVVSGAREMFINEGFDGFVAKPIELSDFERVMKNILPESAVSYEGGVQ
ncbi:MAG: response regulator [Lachnospiraceae bacterium]|nr:response regulator [Lachnospiraceae bacterium]